MRSKRMDSPDPFIAHLKQLCAAHPTRSKWVFMPTHGIGRTIGDRLVLEGTDWANLRFVTPIGIATRMGAPWLVERGIDPSEEQLGPALIMRLLLGLPEGAGYFRPLAHEPRMAIAIWSTLQELRAAGLRATDLVAEAFESENKHTELQALVAAYEQHLEQRKLGDQATVYEEALAHPDWCPIKAEDCWTVLPGVTWSPLQQRFFDLIPGEPEALSTQHKAPSTDLVAPSTEPEAPSTEHPAPSTALNAPSTDLTAPSTDFFTAGGPEAEVEEVFRRILTSKRRLDEVEITCASDGYATLLWEKACRFDWPVTLATGLPATLTRPGRALLGLIEWIEDNFAAGRLRRLLQSGDVKLDSSAPGPSRAARLLVAAQAAWGRDTYRLALTKLAKESRLRAEEDVSEDERQYRLKRAEEADAVAAWVAALITSIPEPAADGHVDLQSVVDAGVHFVAHSSSLASALDHAASSRLASSIQELKALGQFRCPLPQALRFLRERVESLTIGADRPRPGHLHVSRLKDAAYAARPLLFVVGLEEGRVFPAAIEDPVLLDQEREAINEIVRRADLQVRRPGAAKATPYVPPGLLMTSLVRLDARIRATLDRLNLAMASSSIAVTLSYSCRDLRQFRATYASWLMLDAFRQATGNPTAAYQDLHAHLGPPVSSVPATQDDAPGIGRWWLHGAAKAGQQAGREGVLRAFPSLAQGVKAEAARESADFTEFDGHVPEAGPVLDPAQSGTVVSATQLEKAAECPFRHFLERGLGVRAIESGERDRDVWLNPLIRGSLLHDLYAGFLQRCLDDSRTPTWPADHQWLQQAGQSVLDRTAQEMPPPSVEVLERESRDFLEDLHIFASVEVDKAGERTPVALEAAFGPTQITAGGVTLTVRGRIDRIDQMPDGTFEILDYKTGSFFEPAWNGTFSGGRKLQHALYGLAATALLRKTHKKAEVAKAVYYFSSAKGNQHRKDIPMQPKARIGQVLGDLRDVLASGLYVHTPNESDCKFCDYGAACGPRAIAQAEAKQAAPVLEPYRRLQSHD